MNKQERYRDARVMGEYDTIWQSVNKCVFCDLREKYVFFEENGIVMTISLFAYIDGHFMIVPRRHVRSARELTQLEWDTVRKFLYIAKKMIRDVHGIKGMQLIQKDGSEAQSTVQHVHFHCIPFDAPDLSVWNYRTLQYTPLENVERYKTERKKIVSYGNKYNQKYRNTSALPIVCDLVAINTRHEVMLQERAPDSRLIPNYLTLPGGTVEDTNVDLVDELVREVREETAFELDRTRLQLVDSRIGTIERKVISKHLNIAYKHRDRFVWNTYVQSGISPQTKLTPGDDCQDIVWIKTDELGGNPRISFEIRQVIDKAVGLIR